MNTLTISMTKKLRPYTDLYIDDKIVKPKRVKRKLYKVEYQTEDTTAQIKVVTYSRMNTKLWFLIEMFYFLISVFGIFDQRFGKFCYITKCQVNVELQQNTNIGLRLIEPRNNGPVIKVDGGANVEEVFNYYSIDEKAKKHKKILRISKIITVILAIAILIICLVV